MLKANYMNLDHLIITHAVHSVTFDLKFKMISTKNKVIYKLKQQLITR